MNVSELITHFCAKIGQGKRDGGLFALDITDPGKQFLVQLDSEGARIVSDTSAQPTATLTCSEKTLRDLAEKKLKPAIALATGKVRVGGNIRALLALVKEMKL